MRKAVLVGLLTALVPFAGAQRAMPGARFPVSHPSAYGRAFYPLPLFSDSLYSGYAPPVQPTVIVMQATPAPEPIAESFPAPAEPLLIELRGDHYVRVSGNTSADQELNDSESSTHVSLSPAGNEPVLDIKPAVLVFRDGHREDVSEYTITGRVLYARCDSYLDQDSNTQDWNSQDWNRKIDPVSLNLPETINSNRARGIRFRLPTAPNEVIVGP